jgi:hypothetical protein
MQLASLERHIDRLVFPAGLQFPPSYFKLPARIVIHVKYNIHIYINYIIYPSK